MSLLRSVWILPALVTLSCRLAGPQPLPAHVEAARPTDTFDKAYTAIRYRQIECTGAPQSCCARLQEQLDSALRAARPADVARAADQLAIRCPDRREVALASLSYRNPENKDFEKGGFLAVAFRANRVTTDRIYWASAFIDDNLYPNTHVAPGAHQIHAEVHVLTTGQDGKEALHRLTMKHDVTVTQGSRQFFEIELRRHEPATNVATTAAETPFDLVVLEVPAPPIGKILPVGSGPSGPPAGHTLARRKSLQVPRFPAELNRSEPWAAMLSICVDEAGRVASVANLVFPVHPRLFGMLVDSFLRAEYEPYQIDGKPTRNCHPFRFQYGGPS